MGSTRRRLVTPQRALILRVTTHFFKEDCNRPFSACISASIQRDKTRISSEKYPSIPSDGLDEYDLGGSVVYFC
jgi:hypothetical protein